MYTRQQISEAGYRELSNSENPAHLLERMITCEHKDLGKSEVDGVEVVGVEADIPGRGVLPLEPLSIRLWADVKTRWPVRIEPDLTEADVVEALRPYREWKQFLHQLRMDRRDVAWHGSEIIPGDAESVLWRWRLDDGNYRVIYGDLSARTVSPEALEQPKSRK